MLGGRGKVARSILIGSLVASITVAASVGTALASGRLGRMPSIVPAPNAGPAGSSVRVLGSGFDCTGLVLLYWQYNRPAVKVFAGSARVHEGDISTVIRVPRDAREGSHRILATGMAPKCSDQARFTVIRLWVPPR